VRHYADTELTLLARQLGGYVYQPNSVLVEVDWRKDQAAVSGQDRALFQQRIAQGIDGKVTHAGLLGLFG